VQPELDILLADGRAGQDVVVIGDVAVEVAGQGAAQLVSVSVRALAGGTGAAASSAVALRAPAVVAGREEAAQPVGGAQGPRRGRAPPGQALAAVPAHVAAHRDGAGAGG